MTSRRAECSVVELIPRRYLLHMVDYQQLHRAFSTYSPFPADLALDPVNSHRTYIASLYYPFTPFTAATVGTSEPLAHLRRSFEIGGVRLGDFEVRQKTLY